MRRAIVPSVAAVVLASRLVAQDASDSAAYRALTLTPLAAFAPAATVSLTGHPGRGPGAQVRYGIMSYDDDEYVHNVAVGVDLPLGSGRLGLTGGRYTPDCGPGEDCPGHFMVAATYSDRLLGTALGRAESRASLNVGVDLGVGFARPRDETIAAASASVPIALRPGGRAVELVPFVAPGFGIGLADVNGRRETGLRATFATGIAMLLLDGRLGLTAGLQRVFLSGGNWVAGLGASWNGSR